jgi:polyisoprenoid-binding protein YceI
MLGEEVLTYFCNLIKKTKFMTTNWNIDSTHSVIGFKVRHMMISNVTGTFGDFNATAETAGDDFSTAKFSFRAGIDSINTGVVDRDGHLKSADFFDSANHPDLTFVSKSVNKISEEELEILGDMTIRGTTKSVKLKAEFNGIAVDPYGQTKAGLSIIGKIKRSEFGLVWSAVTEAGNIVVGDEITLNTEIQFVKV